MTTIKSILGWLFGVYRDSEFLQWVLMAFIYIHVILAALFYVAWLLRFIARITA